MPEYASILFSEVLKILMLLVPVLVSVAMIVWLDRRHLYKKEEVQMLLDHLVYYNL